MDQFTKQQIGIWLGFAPPARKRLGDLRKLYRIDIVICAFQQRSLNRSFPSA